MALTDSEIQRIRHELGYPNLSVSAEPIIGIVALFEQVIKPYTLGGAATTSSTPVTAAVTPTPQSITLASATGFAANDTVVIDVDARQERVTIQSLTGSSLTAQLSLAHSGTYSVVLESGESLIRDILHELRLLSFGSGGAAGTISSLRARVGLKKVEDVEFFGGGSTLASQGLDPLTQVLELREYWRDELAFALGIERLNSKNNSGGAEIAIY